MQELPSKKMAVRGALYGQQTETRDPRPQALHAARVPGRHRKGPPAPHLHLKTRRPVHASWPAEVLCRAVVPSYWRHAAAAETGRAAGTTSRRPQDDPQARRKSAGPIPTETATAQEGRSAFSQQQTLRSAPPALSRLPLPAHEQKPPPLPQQPPRASVPGTETRQPQPPSRPHRRQPASWKHGQPRHDGSAPTPLWTVTLSRKGQDYCPSTKGSEAVEPAWCREGSLGAAAHAEQLQSPR